jgi:hypothetical protein
MGIIETKLGRLPGMPSPGKFRAVDVRLITSISETLLTYQYLVLYQTENWPGNMC